MTDIISTSETTTEGIKYAVQEPPQQHTVMLTTGDVVTARMPWGAEREALGLLLGVSVLAVARADGTEELYDGNRTRLIIAS